MCKICAKNYRLDRGAWIVLINQHIFSERNRRIVVRRLLDDIPYEYIAEEENLSTQSIKSIFYSALEELKEHIKIYKK